MMQSYETMYILRPDLSEEQVEEAIARYQSMLSERGAHNIEIQNRGKRRLAYEINKHQEGIYIQMNYEADGSHVAPLERAMRLSEEVIRYLTMKIKQPKKKDQKPASQGTQPAEAEA
ncbi:MAG: 30S ribosomal protein S6 [Cyanobacteria bacterium QH_8_48_120]|nr:MAG: 30S ribosomal protein S6 [Cyanobacteria bacterium QH_6_48_35]PSO74951.1 MAG: 30S ribosomal protein S6 [Cyanobacteria bacterium QH_8_48_120]PSO89038.1 MAG: 30S ribosomal protein S6 [Cyanobacteria bacterium QS_3_48_167]PSP06387.1 MAG: 30S ribosomal protein S6 [Cyanobacteria bacterium QS_7_48_42]PSP08355.1 MAG: 30S ribosomal protein S6 [Cyanobacteria bacterium SW_7_48_12]PSP10790.1 MAG: 30S ribosomal protein S6 [Cyanobacteria bacterium SW_11_48_12]PSP12669.1 MAG: 30S ribosomal protein S6